MKGQQIINTVSKKEQVTTPRQINEIKACHTRLYDVTQIKVGNGGIFQLFLPKNQTKSKNSKP